MKKTIMLVLMFVMLLSVRSYADSLEVVSIDSKFQHAILKENPLGTVSTVMIGDIISNCKIEGITSNFVTISKMEKGKVLLIRLPVHRHSLTGGIFDSPRSRNVQNQ